MHPIIPLGRLVITRTAGEALDPYDVALAIVRHSTGNWGELCAEDKALNDAAVLEGSRILSVHQDQQGTKFWIITEADRSATTVLLPDDY
jgi:hypothetical protein